MRERTTGGGEEKKPRTGDEEKLKKNWEEWIERKGQAREKKNEKNRRGMIESGRGRIGELGGESEAIGGREGKKTNETRREKHKDTSLIFKLFF